MKFKPSELYDKMTIIVVAKNLAALGYTFVESFWSSLPLGCRYLVGNFQSTDETMKYYAELAKYAPIETVDIPWVDAGLTGIGIATQELIKRSPTEYVYNLQACEVLCEDTPQTIFEFFKSPEMESLIPIMQFRHFFGNCKFEGTLGGHAYNSAQRLMHRSSDTSQGDGCHPIINARGSAHVNLGMVHRYSYCFRNQVEQKVRNHARHFGSPIEQQFSSIEWCRQRPNYSGYHPSCVSHIIHEENYDTSRSLKTFTESHEPIYEPI